LLINIESISFLEIKQVAKYYLLIQRPCYL